MNIPFLGKKIKWYNMSDLNETELKKGFFRTNQKFCTDDSKRSNIVVDHLNVTIQHNHILKEVSAVIGPEDYLYYRSFGLWKVDFAQELEPSVGYE